MKGICVFGLVLLLNYIVVYQHADAAAVGDRDEVDSMISGQGLYGPSDKIAILNVTNFKSTVYDSKTAWFVEFYNSWCGFCHRFAPTWKALAQDIYHWRDIVVVAAIDCANDDNNPICREYEVMHYPMLKFFSVDAKPGNLGIEIVKGKDMDGVRESLVEQLEKEQQEGRGATWANITPYRSMDTKNVWRDVPDTVKYTFFIFDTADSFLASEVILDLHNISNIHVRGVTSENEPLAINLSVRTFPALVVLDRQNAVFPITVQYATRSGFRKAIRDFLTEKGIQIILSDTSDEHPGEWAKADVPDISEIASQMKEKKEQTEIKQLGDVLFQLDLETALRYSIDHEMSMTKNMNGEKFEAANKYLTVLAKYFPMRRNGVLFLDTIASIFNQRTNMTGADFRQIIKSAEEEMSTVYSGPKDWVGCKGSVKTLRGYPCGLWTMFHTLVVNAAIQNEDDENYDATEVLRAMHGYIKNFFGCADCAQHFVDMAAKNKAFEVSSGNESILWLWRAHNEVNARLAGDETEDPEHKKIQYPSKVQCFMCWHTNGTWNEAEVLQYLKHKYSYSGINYYGTVGKPNDEEEDDSYLIRRSRFAYEKFTGPQRLGWDFTIFDISICVVLYVMSATILVLVCIKFAVKRNYRKKGYVRDLFGKV